MAPTGLETEQFAGALAVTPTLLAAAQDDPAEVDGPRQMASELDASRERDQGTGHRFPLTGGSQMAVAALRRAG